jgi:hypothetical protein
MLADGASLALKPISVVFFPRNALRSSRFGCNDQVCGTPPLTRRLPFGFSFGREIPICRADSLLLCRLYDVPTSTHDQRAILIIPRTLSNGERCLFSLSENLGLGLGAVPFAESVRKEHGPSAEDARLLCYNGFEFLVVVVLGCCCNEEQTSTTIPDDTVQVQTTVK